MKRNIIKKLWAVLLCIGILLSFTVPFASAAYANTYINTGDGAADIIGVALTQEYNSNGSKYTSGAWCCAFVSWCARQANISTAVIPDTASCTDMYNKLSNQKVTSLKSYYFPKAGDLVFFSSTYSMSNIDHIGIVTGTSGSTFYVIEGNYDAWDGLGHRVARTSYTTSSAKVLAFASPNYLQKQLSGLNFRVDDVTNIRSGASTSYSIIGSASAGSMISIDKITADNWGHIANSSDAAWICLNWSTYVSGTFTSSDILNLRATPSVAGTIIDTIPEDTLLTVTKVNGGSTNPNWGYVTLNGRSGWICLAPGADREAEVEWTVVDVSQWNSPSGLDWAKLKASGVKAAILRIGGRYVVSKALYDDSTFYEHYKAAKAAGIHVGAYFFSYALNEAQAEEEAQMTVDTLKKYGCELDMPVFIDMEDYSEQDGTDYQHYNAGKKACTAVANAFCKYIEEAGYYPGIYCSKSFADDLIEPSAFNDRAVWIAHYGVSQCGYKGNYDMWQYTRSGELAGSQGDIDLSLCYTDFPALIAEKANDIYGEHRAGDWETVKTATCSAGGTRRKRCLDCGIVLASEELSPAAHTESELCIYLLDTSIKAGDLVTSTQKNRFHSPSDKDFESLQILSAWETQGGTKLTYCKKCNKVITAEYSYTSCSHTSCRTNTTAATCTANGKQETVCNNCGKTVYSALTPYANHTEGNKVYDRSSCTQYGTCTTYCSMCQKVMSTGYAAPSQHTPGQWTAVKKVTCINDGSYTTNCIYCKEKMQKTVSHPEYGDANANGEIDAADARLALRSSVKLEVLSEAAYAAADVDYNGTVDAADARLLLRISVKLENKDTLMKKYYGKTA